MNKLTVIVPVHDGRARVERCLASVLPSLPEYAEVHIVDDASTDAGLADWLQNLAASDDRVSHQRNEDNRGFAASVNLALEATAGDAVLLNSDTEVPEGWLDRLLAAAQSAPRVATVTPFTNNGSICSYPYFCSGADMPEGLSLQALDDCFRAGNAGATAELPTGVGFCMYVARDCLDELGGFDDDTFGAGYGEEVDFCLRASKAGWTHRLCADLFVFHEGGSSFGDARQSLMEGADTLIAERYPHYGALVESFIASDPLADLRQRVDAARATLPDQAEVLAAEGREREDRVKVQLSEFAALAAQRSETITVYEERLRELDDVLARERADSRAMEGEYRALEVGYKSLEAEYRALADTVKATESAYRERDAAHGALESTYRDLEAAYAGLEQQLEAARAAWRDTDAELGRAQEALAQLEERFRGLYAEHEAASAQRQQLAATVQQLEATVQQLEATVQQLEATVQQLEATVQQQREQIAALDAMLAVRVQRRIGRMMGR